MLKKWEELPVEMRVKEVRPYYDILVKKKATLFGKRLLDLFLSSILILVLFPVFLGVAIFIKLDSQGPIFFRQERITQYGKKFHIHKFRTMVRNAEQLGTKVTVSHDPRITKAGYFLRKYRVDEIPQLIDIFLGHMSFVGTRPEVKKYVKAYSNEMKATLLLPAGVTSIASIKFKDESEWLKSSNDVDSTYIKEILPKKMKYNLESIRDFSLYSDFLVLFKTVYAVIKG